MSLSMYAQKVSESYIHNRGDAELRINIEDDAGNIEIFPNPASDYVNINLTDTKLKNVSFELYDIIGNKINVQAQEMKKDVYRIPVERLHMGYYVLIVSDPYGRYKKAFKFSKR